MSYGISSIDIVAKDGFRLSLEHVATLRERLEDQLPESHPLTKTPHAPFGERPDFEDRADGFRYFNRISWHGEGSGHFFETLTTKILTLTEGWADLVIRWEGGDSYSGLRVMGGTVKEHRVVMTLGAEKSR